MSMLRNFEQCIQLYPEFSHVRTYTTRKDTSSADLQLSIYPYSHSHTHPSTHPHIHSSHDPSIQQFVTLYTDCAEKVEITAGCTYDHSRALRMPVKLLDVLLSQVDEEQLSRDPRYVLSPIGLRCVNVPQCQFVVLARGR